jgi:uncharacterized protein (DUF433 family)
MTLPEFLTEWPGGEIVLKGHRVSLFHVISAYQEGYTAERLQEEFPTVAPEQLRKVLAFYEQNRAEVDDYIARYKEDLDRQYRAGKKLDVDELKRRMQAMGRMGPDGQWR